MCDSVGSRGTELHKRADINDAVGIAEEPIVYTKLAEAVNKQLKRDWDAAEARPERAEHICILLQFSPRLRARFTNNKAISLVVQSRNERVF